MDAVPGRRLCVVFLVLAGFAVVAWAEQRTWTDVTGKHTVEAELVAVEGNSVVLRREDGREVTVPLDRLSAADRAYVESLPAGTTGITSEKPAAGADVITEIAERFYSDLRNKEREVARQTLTQAAEALMAEGKSPLAGLPEPEAGKRAIRLGKVAFEGDVAEVPVMVRANGMSHKTKLHLRLEDDQWRVFALSAVYPDGEKSINFEIAPAAEQNTDPLLALVGQTLDLEGYTLDGRPLNMADFNGKVVLVDFWATWCGPCRAEMPNIRENWEKYHSDGFDVIAVSVDRDLKALNEYVAAEQPPWTVVADHHPRNKKSMAERYGIRGIPAFILVGTDGKVAAVHCRGQRLGQHLSKLLGTGG